VQPAQHRHLYPAVAGVDDEFRGHLGGAAVELLAPPEQESLVGGFLGESVLEDVLEFDLAHAHQLFKDEEV
jgi:hypothetical protein